MMENQLKMKKYEEYLDAALKAGEITKNEKNIMEEVFKLKLDAMPKCHWNDNF